MPVPLKALSAVAGIGLTGAGGYYIAKKTGSPEKQVKKEAPIKELKYHDSRPYTLLSDTEIHRRIRSGQRANTVHNKDVKAVYTNQLASNNPVEDNYSIHTFNQGLIAGVYDGHIGPHCSRLIKTQLPIYMARQLASQSETTDEQVQKAISTAFVDLDQDIQQRFYDIFPKNLKYTTEKDIQQAVARQPDQAATIAVINEAINGSCACTVYIKDGMIYSANTGDSRVVIVSQDGSGQWKGRRLVEEESPADPTWRAHMLSQHPDSEKDVIVMRNRIFGLIAVGGSFGDIMYKVPVEYQMKVLPFIPYDQYKTFARYHHRIVVHYKTPPYLESKPLVSCHKLEKGDKYVILGTDGLWDELSWDNVRSTDGDQQAAIMMSKWNPQEEQNPATYLTKQALLYDAVYKNVGIKDAVEDETLELSKRLTRKPSRNYRDDITITVIALEDTHVSLNEQTDVGPVYETEEVQTDVPRLAQPKSTSWLSGWIWSRL